CSPPTSDVLGARYRPSTPTARRLRKPWYCSVAANTLVPVGVLRRVRERERLEAILSLWRDDQLLDGVARGRVDGPGGLELPRQKQSVEGAEDPVLVVGLPAEPAQHA